MALYCLSTFSDVIIDAGSKISVRKIDLEKLQSDFDNKQWCHFNALENTHDQVSIDIHIQSDLSWFVGHFPQQPVLPGVVQTHWAVSYTHLTLPTTPYV